ncbi:MAG: O-antigen ligase family protein [Pseudonocardia sp.]|nr:O-antigen ligase family protein [Pseudonocardia sp.]
MSLSDTRRRHRQPASFLAPPARAGRAVPVSLILATYVAALMGRFTLDRIGITEFGELDLRLIVCPALAVAALLWRYRPDHPDYRHPWAPSLLWTLAVIGYLWLTVFWAPYAARTDERVADLVYMALLIVVMVVVSGPDPAKARRVVLVATFASGMLYAFSGLVVGQTDEQGRTIAFGGGPNIYVRVVLLGALAAIALAVIYRRKLYLVPVPLLLTAALLASSRGGVLSAGVTAAAFVVLCWRRLSVRAVVAAVLVLLTGLAAGLVLLDAKNLQMIQERFVAAPQQDQFSGRPQLVEQGLALFRDNPVVGGGLDSFYVHFGVNADLGYPHNLAVDVAATGGVVGLVLLAGFVVALIRDVQPWRSLPNDSLALVMAIVFITTASMTSGDFYDSRFLWVFAALAVNPPGRPIRDRDPVEANA